MYGHGQPSVKIFQKLCKRIRHDLFRVKTIGRVDGPWWGQT